MAAGAGKGIASAAVSGGCYQIFVRWSAGLYNLSPGFTSKASYHASILVIGPLVRYSPGECGSVTISCAAVLGSVLLRQTCAQLRKNRCLGVNPSLFLPSLNSLVLLKAS